MLRFQSSCTQSRKHQDKPVYGLVLMLTALCTGRLKSEQVKETSAFLIEIMPVMFIPAAAGLLDSWPSLKPMCIPIILITLLTTVIVMAVTGLITQLLLRRSKKGRKAGRINRCRNTK